MKITTLTSISLWLTCCCLILCCNSHPVAEDTRSAPEAKFLGLGAGGLFGGLFSEVDVSGTWSPGSKPGKPNKKKPHKRPGHGGGGASGGYDHGGGFFEDLIGSWIWSDLNHGCKRKC